MKNASVILAVICLAAALACGEPEEVDDDVVLVDPASETVVSETTMTEIGTDTGMIEELDVETETTATVDSVTPASTETVEPAASPRPTPTRPTGATPTAPERTATPDPTPTPATRPDPEPDPEPAPKTEPEPAAEPEPAPATSSKLPKTHTVDQGGVMHAPGAENATKRCVACHGKDLQGGRVGVSCFDCHDKQWE